MRGAKLALVIFLALTLTGSPRLLAEGEQAAAPARAKTIQLPFQEFTLKNGLRVILSEDHNAPTVSVAVLYDVGSRDERPGRTGFAHLFEHMMFQGSANVGRREHTNLIEINGGGANGTTDNDRTAYYETLPANQMDLVLFLEADRMRGLNLTEAALKVQRNAVQEERRLRIDDQPYGPAFLAIDELAYENFAYKHSVIGSMDDLNAARMEDFREFFRVYYAPNNAVLSMVGDFKTADALAKVRKYFESIPSQPAPPRPNLTEPPSTKEKRLAMEDAFARSPRLFITYKVSPGNHADWAPLDIAGDVLVRGQSSRLFQKLVREKQVALNVFGGPDQRVGQSLFTFDVTLRPGVKHEDVEKLIYEEITRLQQEPPTAAELAKIAMQNRRTRALGMYSSLGRAIQLAEAAVRFKDPALVNKRPEQYAAVTPADVQRVAKQYWQENNRSVITVSVKQQAGGAQ